MRNHRLAIVGIGAIIANAAGIAICLWIDWFPEAGSTAADQIDTLWDVLLICSVPIFVLVMSVVLYNVWEYRVKPGDMRDGEHIHGSTKLEILWVTIPFIMVSALAAYAWIVLDDIEEKDADALLVDVRGRQFAWDFKYPEEGNISSNRLVVPQGRQIEFDVRSEDVIHDFWVPQWRLKTDAVPGITTHIRVTPTKTGHFTIVCAELCGIGHSTMRQGVTILPEREFRTWLAAKRGGSAKQAASTNSVQDVDGGSGGG